ncbi:mucin-19-like, partial [Chiloscyllium plagiosum]|uniref:mucin-19-like n=1 Tax=Chiloscyllium plagiosum TaxID=36176 RepID=UPI001CB86B50
MTKYILTARVWIHFVQRHVEDIISNVTCKAGYWECTKNPCPKDCLVHGEGHYVTFDRKRYLYDGNCEYVLVEDQCSQENGTFQILVESVPCCENGVICSRIIRIFTEAKEFKLHDGRMTRIEKSFGQTQCTDSSYSLHTVGLYLIIKFSNGITVIWDKRTRVSITLDPRWKNKVCGLCGNFNGDITDDLTTQGNCLVTSTLEFGNSWKSSVFCSDVMNQTFPCDRNPYCSAWAQRKCSIIKTTVFQSCHSKVDPTPFYDTCVQETCSCDLEGRHLSFCTSIAVYAEACNKAGVCIDWRTPDLCPVYCDYYNAPEECSWHYHPCGTLTTKTCSDHYVGKKFSAKLEGCYAKCPVSAPYLDENIMKCVKLADCTCYHNGKILQPGEVIWNVCEECKCDNGTVTCRKGVTTTVKPTTTISTTVSISVTTTPKETTSATVIAETTTPGVSTTIKPTTTRSTTSSTLEVTTSPKERTTTTVIAGTTTIEGISTTGFTTSSKPELTTTVKETTAGSTPVTTSAKEMTTPTVTAETTTKEVTFSPKGTPTTTVIAETTTKEVTATPKETTGTTVIAATTTTEKLTPTVKPTPTGSTTSIKPELTTRVKETTAGSTPVTTSPKEMTTPTVTTETTTTEVTFSPKGTPTTTVIAETTSKGLTATPKPTTTTSTTQSTSEVTATPKETTGT